MHNTWSLWPSPTLTQECCDSFWTHLLFSEQEYSCRALDCLLSSRCHPACSSQPLDSASHLKCPLETQHTCAPLDKGERNFFKPLGNWLPLLWNPQPWVLTILCCCLLSSSCELLEDMSAPSLWKQITAHCGHWANRSVITARLALWSFTIEG